MATEKAAEENRAREISVTEERGDFETRAHGAICNLGTPGWHDAESLLISYGSRAIPLLIEAMGNDTGCLPAYTIGGLAPAPTAATPRASGRSPKSAAKY